MKRLLWQLRKPATRTHQARDEIRRWMLERGSSLFAATYLHSRRYPAYYYIVHSHCWRLCSNNDSQSDLEIGSALSNRCQRGTWLKAQRFQLPRLSFRLLQPRDTDIASIAESRSVTRRRSIPTQVESRKHFHLQSPQIAWSIVRYHQDFTSPHG
jgi:hypothetical protein